ncbi:TonB-dependent receptor [Montanilutibacter psychrotolerans]|uniref:TonB-dependent siderophore receptor n=1 Tax=Montanilutibacter psychrotolerans TaxID=1327343 RepID=A0A3M8SXI7_9GAMM|nr:TonB-dependent siderophore receptor [Lysobacter psychrotolerans]RNF86081.1 TonB-dependent siderophore receptor [Lysobacter psychrotolerans]
MSNLKLALSPLAGALALALSSLPAIAAPSGTATGSAPQDLDSVEVQGQRVAESRSAKITQPLLDTPQSVTIVSADLMKDQGVTSLRDALRNVPGISMQAGEGGVPAGDNLSLRGFSARTDLFVDGIRDFGGYSRDSFNLEQIEVVKGPASTHSGRGSTGGSINLSSKSATNESFNRVGISVGDDSLLRTTADFNHVLGDSSAFRVNLMGHDAEVNGRDHVENKRWGVAPTLSLGLGTSTIAQFSLFHLEQDNVPDYGQPWVPGTNNAIPASRDLISPVDRSNWYGLLGRDYEKTETDMATVSIQHDFNDKLRLGNVTRWGRSTRDSVLTAPRFANDNGTAINPTPKTRDSIDDIVANVTDLTAVFNTGAVEHTLLAGLELSREKSSNRARIEDASAPATPTLDLFNPNAHGSFRPLIRDALGDTRTRADSAAVYVFDTLVLNPQWELSAGLRWDHFKAEATVFDRTSNAWTTYSRTDEVLSGRVGAVFKPVENGSIYLGYGTSFNPSAEGMSLNAALVKVEPEKSRTLELGTKWNLFGNRLMLTSALFRTEKTNMRLDADTSSNVLYVLDGEQRVDGFEISAAGQITDAWTINAGVAWLDGETTKNRVTPAEVGNDLPNTPRRSANLWTSYQVTEKFDVGFGAQHVGSRFTSTANTREAKAYTTFDAMLGYRINDAVALRLNGYNLSNKQYVDRVGGGHYTPGAERTFMLSADFSF